MMSRFNRNTRPRTGSYTTGGVARGLRQRYRTRSYTASRQKNQTRGIGVTQQHDARVIYVKKRMPSFKRNNWRRFKSKVLAVSEKDLGSQQVVFNKTYSFTNTTADNQVTATAGLYTLSSTTAYMNDLKQISGYIANAATTVDSGLTVDPSTKILFQSGVLDITIRNASTFEGDPSSEARMEVDVYELYVQKEADESGTVYQNLFDLFGQNSSVCKAIGGGATAEVAFNKRGCTPFDLSYVLSRFGVKIVSKRKYQISNNDQITYQIRDPRRHSMTFRDMTNGEGFNMPKLTKLVWIVGKLAPGLTVDAAAYSEKLEIGMTRKYLFKVENWSEDRTAWQAV